MIKIKSRLPALMAIFAISAAIIFSGCPQGDSPGNDQSYTIQFDANGGQGTMQGIIKNTGDQFNLPLNTFSRDGYNFVSWNTAANAGGTQYANGAFVMNLAEPGGTVALYAQWAKSAIDYTKLILNEVSGNGKYVEIYNSGTAAIPLEGVKLQRNGGPASGSEWAGGASDSIPAGAYRLFLFNNFTAGLNSNPAYVGWTVGSGISSGQILKVAIVDPAGVEVSVFIRGDAPLPAWQTTTGVTQNTTNSYSRMSNGTWAYAAPTPGSANGTSAGLIVNPGYLTAQPDLGTIASLAGNPKAQGSWGALQATIPNNIGNTFTGDPRRTRTITWQSTIAAGEVILDGSDATYPSTATLVSGYYHHCVNLTGLTPGEKYYYIAGSTGSYSPVYSFKTESTSTAEGFTVLHITDPQISNAGDAAIWKRVIEKAAATSPEPAFIVNTGDTVDNSSVSALSLYFDYAQDTIADNAFIYTMGNNDAQNFYNRYYYTPDNGGFGGVLYSWDYGSAHFVSIDSNVTLSVPQMAWLENDLKNTSQKWKVAITHQGDYGRTGSNTAVTKLFDTYNVALVMAGHNHFYARTKPIDTSGNDKPYGTVWSIPNAAGSKFNAASGETFLAVDEQPNLPMFSEFKFTDTSIVLKAYTVSGTGAVAEYDTYIWADLK
jgi:predicted phosphodiesterase